jgi:hypothetical protein
MAEDKRPEMRVGRRVVRADGWPGIVLSNDGVEIEIAWDTTRKLEGPRTTIHSVASEWPKAKITRERKAE